MKSTFTALTLASALSLATASCHSGTRSNKLAQRRALRGFERRRLQTKREYYIGIHDISVGPWRPSLASIVYRMVTILRARRRDRTRLCFDARVLRIALDVEAIVL